MRTLKGTAKETADIPVFLERSLTKRINQIGLEGKFAPIPNEEPGPEWDYFGIMSEDAKTFWTMAAEICVESEKVHDRMKVEGKTQELARQDAILHERFDLFSGLVFSCIKEQVMRDLIGSGMDTNNLEICFSEDFKLFIRESSDENDECQCPLCQARRSIMSENFAGAEGDMPELLKLAFLASVLEKSIQEPPNIIISDLFGKTMEDLEGEGVPKEVIEALPELIKDILRRNQEVEDLERIE
ncbi:MAG: hypothetical protein WC180_03530 [Candidatus Paceibacterota bacterium]